MTKPHILVSEHLGPTALKILNDGPVTVEAYDLLPEDEFRARLAVADAVIIRSAHSVRRAHLDGAPRLRVVARAGAGVDNIDIDEATRRGVVVINTPGGNAVAAAEHTLGLLLAVMRHVPAAHRHVHEGGWNRQAFFGRELNGRRLGIIGIGRVGSRVAQRARAFGMTVSAYDPYLSPEVIRERGAEPVDDLNALLAVSDVLTLHTPKTGPRLGYDDLRRLPAGAVVLNVARGGLIDETALHRLLEEGHIWGAALDVFAKEPPPADHPLFQHPRVVVTCHLGGSTQEAQDAIGEQVARSVLDALSGRMPAGTVNLPKTDDVADPSHLVLLGRATGQLMAMSGAQGRQLTVEARGNLGEGARELLTRAVLLGYLEAAGEESCNLVSAVAQAQDRGIEVLARAADTGDAGEVAVSAWMGDPDDRVELRKHRGGLRLARFWGAHFDTPLTPHLLVTRHLDRPGIVGALGTIMGDAGVNIATMELGRHAPGGEAVMLMGLDSPVPAAVAEHIRQLPAMRQVLTLTLNMLTEPAVATLGY
jgi:D-3-phosphoglycerate dehydrogenase